MIRIVILFLWPLGLMAQGGFSTCFKTLDSVFFGNLDHFYCADSKLWLNAPAQTGLSRFIVPNSNSSLELVEFSHEFLFNPSSANYAEFWICSSDSSQDSQSGLYFRLGYSDDGVELFYKNQEKTEKLFFIPKVYAFNFNRAHLKLLSLNDSLILSVITDSTKFTDAIPFNKSQYIPGLWAIYQCHYTSTRSTKFNISGLILDGLQVIDSFKLQHSYLLDSLIVLRFSEPLLISQETRCLIDSGDSLPVSINKNYLFLGPVNIRSVVSDYLYLEKVQSVFGGSLDSLIPIHFIPSAPRSKHEALFSEIMPDPTPPVGEDAFEWIELYNPNARALYLDSCALLRINNLYPIDPILINPQGFLVLCADPTAWKNQAAPILHKLSPWPNLRNTGDTIKLACAGKIIASLRYSESMHRPEWKEGGHSLEFICADNCCQETDLCWTNSLAALGGTPGYRNSQVRLVPSQGFSHFELSEGLLSMVFSSGVCNLDFVVPWLADSGNYVLNHNRIEYPSRDNRWELPYGEVVLCGGDKLSINTIDLESGAIQGVNPFNVKLSEIYFDPPSEGKDFVELFNTSMDWVSLKGLEIRVENFSGTNTLFLNQAYLLPPQGVLVISPNCRWVQERWQNGYYNCVDQPLPNLVNDGGEVFLYKDSVLLDRAPFSNQMHQSVLNKTENFSLEKFGNHWQSAGLLSGGASPGFVRVVNSEDNNAIIWSGADQIESKDALRCVQWQANDHAYIQAKVFTLDGHDALDLLPPTPIWTHEQSCWDETTWLRLKPGAYIIRLELELESGKKEVLKKLIAIKN